MPKSEFVKNLDALQTHATAFLKPLGFRKKGRTHNRTTEGDLVHVVNFQMGEYPIGEKYVIPGLRESYYGKFAVNLAVLLPCLFEVERHQPVPGFVQEYDCTIRNRLGSLAFGSDQWFELTYDVTTFAKTLVQLLDQFGLPFLEQFPDYQSVLAYYDSHGKLPHQNSGRAALEVAIVANHLGDRPLSQRLFARAWSAEHVGFREYVSGVAKRLGYQVA